MVTLYRSLLPTLPCAENRTAISEVGAEKRAEKGRKRVPCAFGMGRDLRTVNATVQNGFIKESRSN